MSRTYPCATRAAKAFAFAAVSATLTIASSPTAGAAASVVGYKNPLRSVHQLFAERIDEGVDYSGYGPVYAIGRAKVIYVNTTGAWFPPAPDYIAYRLGDGAAKGFTVYVAECIKPRVTVGQVVGPNTVVGHMTNCGYGIETGWANGHRLPDASAAACYARTYNAQGNDPSGYGMNFSKLLQRLGAPPGHVDGTPICPMPAGARPSW